MAKLMYKAIRVKALKFQIQELKRIANRQLEQIKGQEAELQTLRAKPGKDVSELHTQIERLKRENGELALAYAKAIGVVRTRK